jgi:hypothetical protein
MAQCKNCSAVVGCGCQLKNGLCGMCHGLLTNKATVIAPKSQEDVTTKTN